MRIGENVKRCLIWDQAKMDVLRRRYVTDVTDVTDVKDTEGKTDKHK